MMPSMDFKRVWQSGPTQQPSYASSSSAAATYGSSSGGAGRAGGGGGGGYAAQSSRPSSSSSCALSIWRPVGPPGYASLGDVAMAGSEPPSGRPVKMYKDVVGAGDAPGSQVGGERERVFSGSEIGGGGGGLLGNGRERQSDDREVAHAESSHLVP